MIFREKLSSTNTLGLRVEAIKLAEEPPQNKFQRVKMRSDVRLFHVELWLPP
jgi:1D-myo-inositol-triphosphate 3-kinase